VLGKLLFVKDIHVLVTDEDRGGGVLGRTAEGNSVAHHERADGELVVVEGMQYRCHCRRELIYEQGMRKENSGWESL
jgi:hypothetical protein